MDLPVINNKKVYERPLNPFSVESKSDTISSEKQEKTESIAPVETAPAPASSNNTDDTKDKNKKSGNKPASKVINKTKGKKELHTLKTTDVLTTIADLQEEEFIEQVDIIHEQSA
ncbi:MAG TPA: hypothetical protein PKK54_01505 [bacterium]|nr:hypothetical protein [bacterium]